MKKNIRFILLAMLALGGAICVSGCLSDNYMAEASRPSPSAPPPYWPQNPLSDDYDNDEFDEIIENNFVSASETPDSYFSLNINTASYAIIRRNINNGAKIYKDQALVEEMLNYFKFDYPVPESGEILSLSGSLTPCPWNKNSHLLSIGIKTEEIEMSDIDNNLVFLIDISGSMNSPDRLPLVQQAFMLLAEQLNQNDRVSIVTYASGVNVILDGAMGYEKNRICGIIEDLSASGSTSGSAGIQKAYELAAKYFRKEGNNRVILATDGDFNVGISSQSELEKFISQKRDTGVYLSVLGVGMGNQKNNKMETLANCGNGNFAYLDTIAEARKVLIEEAGGTLKTVAQDTKAMVSFNPDYIDTYRQIGYENRQLTSADWENEDTDAGELGAGRCITAVYEVILADNAAETSGTFVTATIRFKVPETGESREIFREISEITDPDDNVLFISAVVESALIMRDSPYKGSANIDSVITRLESIELEDEYKIEFLQLMKHYKLLLTQQ